MRTNNICQWENWTQCKPTIVFGRVEDGLVERGIATHSPYPICFIQNFCFVQLLPYRLFRFGMKQEFWICPLTVPSIRARRKYSRIHSQTVFSLYLKIWEKIKKNYKIETTLFQKEKSSKRGTTLFFNQSQHLKSYLQQ